MWNRINRALDKSSLGAIPFVQQTEDGLVVDITDTNEMNREIQTVTEKRFDLLMSAPITMPSLRSHLGFLSDTDFANSLLMGDVHIPWDGLANGMLLAVTDGSYDRETAPTVSGLGWMIVCTACQRTLRGSFFEVSWSAGSYRGKLLGLVAIHTFATAIAQYFCDGGPRQDQLRQHGSSQPS